MENLFDTDDDPNKIDEEFSPIGRKEWTVEKLNKKLEHLAQVIRFMNNGNAPDLLGVEEVEHQAMLDSMLSQYFKDKNYGIAYRETPDNRGIDCGLIYNADKFEYISHTGHVVILPDKYPTRLILETHLKISGDDLYVFVNHWPSRRGGEKKSAPNRAAAAKVLKKRVEEILKIDSDANIVITGDFNDEPNNNSIHKILGAKYLSCDEQPSSSDELYNLAYESFDEGWGTYLYRGDWNMLDQIIVSGNLIERNGFDYECGSFEIVKPKYLVEQAGKYKGSALPTFGGSKYLAGYSDHFPVGARIVIEK